jgi:hypothetical protein
MSEQQKGLKTDNTSRNMPAPLQPGIQKLEIKDVSQTSASTFGILTQTRRLGAWLTSMSGEKIEISSKDLNTVAPSTY